MIVVGIPKSYVLNKLSKVLILTVIYACPCFPYRQNLSNRKYSLPQTPSLTIYLDDPLAFHCMFTICSCVVLCYQGCYDMIYDLIILKFDLFP